MVFSITRITICFFLVLGTLMSTTSIAHAQLSLPPGFKEEVLLEMVPKVPAPGQNVNVRVESFSTDLKRSTIRWSVTDGQKAEGVGLATFTFTAPPAGTVLELTVTVVKENGEELTEKRTIATADVDLLIEADTYTPPFYKGRSLFTHQAVVTLAAIPNVVVSGETRNPAQLIYTWEKDDQVIQDASGYGKNRIQFLGSVLSRPFYVTVTVEAQNTAVKARRRILVEPTSPKVIVYENNPLYGSIFERAITNKFRFDREEVGLTAVPYFFSVRTKNDKSLSYAWAENGTVLQDPTLGANLTFTNKGLSKSGISEILVGTSHLNNLLQSARINFALDVVGNETLETQINRGNVTVF